MIRQPAPPALGHELRRVRIEPSGGTAEWLELLAFKDLFLILAQRDIKLRYRQTALGVVWVILQPLVASLIFALIFGVLAKLPSDGTPYLLFVFAGILPWNLFAGGLQRGGNSLITDSRLITKIYFPRAIIPLASIASVVLDFLIAGSVMLVLIILYQAPFTLSLLGLPVVMVVALATTVGLSFFFSALNVYYRDFAYALPFILQAWMYASPVVYSSSLIPEEWRVLYNLNPMVGVIDGFRWALLGAPLPSLALAEGAAVAGLVLVLGAWVFRRVERSFADVV